MVSQVVIIRERERERHLLERCLRLEQALATMRDERDDWRETAIKRADKGKQ